MSEIMERVPEPELMDEAEQARAYSEADFAEPHEAFVDAFAERHPRGPGPLTVDLGCGPSPSAATACTRPGSAIGSASTSAMCPARRSPTHPLTP